MELFTSHMPSHLICMYNILLNNYCIDQAADNHSVLGI